jgi:hypothetical protein
VGLYSLSYYIQKAFNIQKALLLKVCLLSKHKALSSNLHTTNQTNKRTCLSRFPRWTFEQQYNAHLRANS